MATITAQLTVNSDISEYNGPTINKTMTMTKAGTNNGLERTSGLQRKYLTAANQVDLIQGAAGVVADMTVGASSAAKIYIKYLEADTSKYLTIGLGIASTTGTAQANDSTGTATFELGRLYGDEWMIIPCSAIADDGDIVVLPSSATTADPAIVEYIVFFE